VSRLPLNTTAAERARGCVFSETFENPAAVARNGGSPVGSPAIDKGVTLDGSTQYVQYEGIVTNSFILDRASVVLEFYPDFAVNDGVSRYLWATGPDDFILKVSSDTLNCRLGKNTVVCNPGTYQSYWYQNKRNVLVVEGDSSGVRVYLNGYLVGSVVTPFVSHDVLRHILGFRLGAGVVYFDGRITKFQIYDRKLTQQEALDFYNDDVYSYREQTSLDLPMGAAQHDPTNVRTLDVSGNARHATFGDGSTPTTYPTKLARHGYDFDGGDYMTVVGTGVFNAAGVTIAIEFEPDFEAGDGSEYFIFDSTSGVRYYVRKETSNDLRVVLGQSLITDIAPATYSPYWSKNRRCVLVVSGVSADTSVWINGVPIVQNDNTAWTQTDPAVLSIGARYDGAASQFNGKITRFMVWQKALTPLQVADLTLRLGRKANDD